jgi:hypothetical protein
MKNINIPEPCSEDWNKMTPNEKGAFCQKCALDVYDFTNKSADEIREVLTLNMANPVCMRIEPRQLDKLNSDFSAWKIQNKQSYQRAWIFTLFVIFGMTLFSCEEDEEPVVKEYQKIGQAILNEQEDKVGDSTLMMDQENSSIVHVNSDSHQLPQMDINEAKVPVVGKPIYKEEEPQKVYEINEVVVVSRGFPLRDDYALGGVPQISPEYNDYLVVTNAGLITDSIDLSVESKISGMAYPNPASNETTLQLKMPRRGKAEIELFALNGQKIRTIHSGRIRKGESEYLMDLTDLESGMYLVVVSSGKMKETIKFSKI